MASILSSPRTALAGLILTLSLTSSLALAAGDPDGAKKLSNETTLSRYANPNDTGPIRVSPDSGARVIARLKINTEDRLPNVYLVLRQFTDASSGDSWYEVRVPGRPNGRTGWVREDSLGPLQTVTTQLIVDRKTLRATLLRKGHKVFRAPIGVGKKSTPTPGGRFWIREKLVLKGGHGAYGPLAFGTSAYSDKLTDWPRGGVVGIHGTNEPRLVPGRPSHGCVRMHNGDIKRLARLMPVGTPVLIK
jgi:lipoprotein-anchoring transpeptidase ErfK/SrfK